MICKAFIIANNNREEGTVIIRENFSLYFSDVRFIYSSYKKEDDAGIESVFLEDILDRVLKGEKDE